MLKVRYDQDVHVLNKRAVRSVDAPRHRKILRA